jgi:hypothetical protein
VVPAFTASADFAIDKPARKPCVNLLADSSCSIHDRLRDTGFAGCTVYDCFGAGQFAVQQTFHGHSWREGPEIADAMFAAFGVLRDLHELLWYLDDAAHRADAAPWHREVESCRQEIQALTRLDADRLVAVDTAAVQAQVAVVLTGVSELVRAGATRPENELRGADLFGMDLSGRDLRAANLRGSYLIRAMLREADLRLADVLGADLRGADVRGADLSTALFLTQAQVNATHGDEHTRLSPTLDRPGHWTS